MSILTLAGQKALPAQATPQRWSSYHSRVEDIATEIEIEPSMTRLDEITGALLNHKSQIMGQLARQIVEAKYADLLHQEWCTCEQCDKDLRVWAMRSRTIDTKVGSFELSRPYFYCRDCQVGYYPLDEALCLSDSRIQYDIQEVEADLASEMPYEVAQEVYRRITGDSLSVHHIHDTTNAIGEQIDLLAACPSKDEIQEQIKVLSSGRSWRPVMMLGIDGSHGPMRPEPTPHPRKGKRGQGEWKEIKGFRLYLLDGKEIHHLISWHQIYTDKELAQDLQRLKEAGLIPQDQVRLGVIGDGAPWIWNRCRELFPSAKEILDRYHCSEHLHDVANEYYGKGTRQAQQWVEAALTMIYYGHVDDVVSSLDEMSPVGEVAQEKIDKLGDYLSEHEARIPYGSVKRGGYHIGSGAIESSNKFICNTRLKRSGAWWYIRYANNMLKIRCAKYNGTLDRIIEDYRTADQARIRNNRVSRRLRLVE